MNAPTIELLAALDYQQIKHNFVDELTKASHNQPSSISFIKHQLPTKPLITKGIVQGIVIGGTNYIISTEELTASGKRNILTRETGVLPIFTDRKSFVDFLSEHMDQRADAVSLNFGFRMQSIYGSDGSMDGFVQSSGTKEHTFNGITESIGTLVKLSFMQKYHKKITTAVANDTICLLLSGACNEQGSLIVGTGINIGLRVEKNTLVNLEVGNFDKFLQSSALKVIDSHLKNPGKKLFEKTTSGKYLSIYFNEKAKKLGLTIPVVKTSQELSELSQHNYQEAGELAQAILKRSAYFLATALAGVYEFSGKPPKFTFITEGSLIWNGWRYRENIQEKLLVLGIPQDTVEINQIKDSSINGAISLLTKY